jgi:CheY-like chemotaxis protein
MKTPAVRALIIDNEQRNIDAIKDRLGLQFEGFGWKVSWNENISIETGQRSIAASPPYDLVVVDLMFPRTDLPEIEEARGLELVAEAVRNPDTFVLAISGGRDHLLNLLSDARQKRAHHATLRRDFSTESREHSPEIIANEIKDFLIDHGTIDVCKVSADEIDPAVQSLLHDVGQTTLVRLHDKILRADGHVTDNIHVRSLAQGASGARVCTVRAEVNAIGPREHVLKLSTSQRQLRKEAERGRSARHILPSQLLVRQEPAEPVGPVNDWFALAGPLVKNAVTWRRWLAGNPSRTQVSAVLETLFVDGLDSAYTNGKFQPERPTRYLALSDHRKQQALEAVSELKDALAHHEGAGLGSATSQLTADLANFITDARLIGVPPSAIPQSTFVAYAHGDLHGGNLLVTTRGTPAPLLIDLSDFDRAHWATDPARFAVDLLMRSVDKGAESMFFRGLKSWCSLVTAFAEGESALRSMTGTSETAPALAALSWLAVNLHRVCPPLKNEDGRERHRWEWHLALATYLVRSSYQPDLPPPKRCLALIAAHDQLLRAADTLPPERG